MKTANQIIEALPQRKESGKRSTFDVSKRVKTLWVMMVDDYGELWVRRHGEKPSMAWCRTIDSLTNEQLKQGLRKLEDSKEFIEYPPNRKQFKDLCLAASHEIPTVKALGLERRELTDDEHQLALDNLKKMKGELMK